MEHQEAKALLDKYRNHTCTEAELAILESWYNKHELDDIVELSIADWAAIDETTAPWAADAPGVKAPLRLWPRIAALSMAWKIAAAVAAITLGVWLYNISNTPRQSRLNVGNPELAHDVAPGKNTATLTLANGKVINLDTNKTSVVVADSVRTMTMLTASTPRGGQYQVVLPDGTRVWLNADSKLSFPSQFIGKERKVLLLGEAYFAVVHNAKQPFRVESRGQVVEDIGTEFNISAYADEAVVKTTLVEGSAKVNDVLLVPDQEARLSEGKITVQQANLEEVTAWKNGYFRFNDEKMSSVMKKLERWYNVEINLSNKLTDLAVTGKIARSRNISAVLRMMEKTNSIQFKIEGRRVTAIEK